MGVLATLGIVLLLAFLVESLVEFLFGTVAGLLVAVVPALDGQLGPYKTPVLQVCAIAAGMLGAFIYQFDLLFLLGQFLASPVPLTPYGVAITGIAIGKGSNYLHQVISQFFPAKG